MTMIRWSFASFAASALERPRAEAPIRSPVYNRITGLSLKSDSMAVMAPETSRTFPLYFWSAAASLAS